jgi:hypothetical protein
MVIKDEIKFLYMGEKKELNMDLQFIHLHAAKEWGKL